jgi:hypothetical protein
MAHLHVRRGEKVLGPFSPSEIKRMIEDNKIVGTDMVCMEDDTDWVQLSAIPALARLLKPTSSTSPAVRNTAASDKPPPLNPPSPKKTRKGKKQTNEWDQLAALENRGATAPPEMDTPAIPGDAAENSEIRNRPTARADSQAGADWDPARSSLNFLFFSGIARSVVIAAAAGVVIMKHLVQLTELGMGVFIPSAAGNAFHFKDNELMFIGLSATVVVALLVILLFLTFSRAPEVFLFVAGGLGVAVALTAVVNSGEASTDSMVLKMVSALGIIVVLCSALGGGPLLWSPLATSTKIIQVASVLAGLVSCCVALLGFTATINVDLAMSEPVINFPTIPGMAVAYALALSLEIGCSAWVMRALALKFGDVQEKDAIEFFLFFHVLNTGLILVAVYMINQGVVTNFGGTVIGCIAAMLAAASVILHCVTILYTRNAVK